MRSTFLLRLLLLCITCLAVGCAHSRYASGPISVMAIEKNVELPEGARGDEIIQIAKRYLGARYKFGASSAKAIDCSGFVQLVFRKEGIHLPRSSYSQAQFGRLIENRTALKPADLVFFETYHKGPSHVGIYLGEDRFIHASTGQSKVTISSMNSEYYVKRFLGGKRILMN